MKKISYITIVILIFLILNSCKLINPPEKIPAYLYIPDIAVNANTGTQGSNSDKITDAWVYVNDKLIGIYEIPAKVPIIAEGIYNLKIYAGIQNSGFVAQRKVYPFYKVFETNLTFSVNTIDTIIPIVEYQDNITIWIENFEDPGIKFDSPPTSDTTILITTNPNEVREGNGSGKVIFDPSDFFFEAQTNEPDFNNFPKFGVPVYIEMEYKTNHPFTLGLYHGDNTTAPIKSEYITLSPTNGKWNKIYIDYTEPISSRTAATKYQIYFEINRQSGITTPTLLLDNIKVLY